MIIGLTRSLKVAGLFLTGVLATGVATAEITLEAIGRYSTGKFDKDSAIVVAHDPLHQRLYVVNRQARGAEVLDISDPTHPVLLGLLDVDDYGRPTYVAVAGGFVAVAVEDNDTQDPGSVVFFDSAMTELSSLDVGALPDMMAFTPDGSTLLVANEGELEPEVGKAVGAAGVNDPEGSISVIDVSNGFSELTQDDVRTADFTGFDAASLEAMGVRIVREGATAAEDLEPEYLALSSDSTTAWIALQENNALAEIDIATATITGIVALGLKDHRLPENKLDVSNYDGEINITNWPVYGLYQPDGIGAYEVAGQTYLVLINEGTDRASEETRVKDLVLDPDVFPDAAELQLLSNLGNLQVTNADGDIDDDGDYDELFSFGGRSFSIRTTDGTMIYDSELNWSG